MGMMPLEKPELYNTSSCPVRGGMQTFEQWPYPLFQVLLGQPKFIDAKGSMACD
jgi:hypothetical protein